MAVPQKKITKELKARLEEIFACSYSQQALFILQMQKQTKSPLTEEWVNEMQFPRTVEYYLAFKRREVLTHTLIWMNLENFID